MIGLGTLINTGAILLGGFSGHLFGKALKERHQDALNMACGVSVLFIGMAGAMAIVGAIQDGLLGDWSLLATKAVLDFIIIMVMTCTLGKGCIFSAIPVCLFEGFITIFASFLKPVMTELAMDYLSMIGAILIFCVGMNLVWGKKVRVANMLPAVIFSVAAAFIKF